MFLKFKKLYIIYIIIEYAGQKTSYDHKQGIQNAFIILAAPALLSIPRHHLGRPRRRSHPPGCGYGNLAYNNGSLWQVDPRSGCKMNAVDMSDAHTAHIACDGNILVFSLNTRIFSKASVETANYNSVSFHDGVGYACGDGGRVAKYTDGEWRILKNPDGGYDWVKYVLRTNGALTNIVASDRQTAYAMTDRKNMVIFYLSLKVKIHYITMKKAVTQIQS